MDCVIANPCATEACLETCATDEDGKFRLKDLFLYDQGGDEIKKGDLVECLWEMMTVKDGEIKWDPKADDACPKQFACGGVVGNVGMGSDTGSYLTMISLEGLKFGIINIVGNFGTVFCDQSYWQSAIAAKPASAHKGYMLGGMVWSHPVLARVVARRTTPSSSPSRPQRRAARAARGRRALGPAGWAIAIMLFMAVISMGSAMPR